MQLLPAYTVRNDHHGKSVASTSLLEEKSKSKEGGELRKMNNKSRILRNLTVYGMPMWGCYMNWTKKEKKHTFIE